MVVCKYLDENNICKLVISFKTLKGEEIIGYCTHIDKEFNCFKED